MEDLNKELSLADKFDGLMIVCDPTGFNANDPELASWEGEIIDALTEYEVWKESKLSGG